MKMSRLLYLGFAFPPGVQERHPELNPAGHAFEVQMIGELHRHFELRTVGLVPVRLKPSFAPSPASSGVPHDLVLEECAPKLFHRCRSLIKLRQTFSAWRAAGWSPDAVLTYNLSPVYNAFIRGLPRSRPTIKRILLLLDSAQLGHPLSWSKRARYRFKPLVVPDSEMLPSFDAAIGLSQCAARYFAPHGTPFLWMPGGCTPARAQTSEKSGFDREQGAMATRGQEGEAPDKVRHASKVVRQEPHAAIRKPNSREDEAPAEPSSLADSTNHTSPLTSSEPIRFGYFGALAAHSGVRELVNVFRATPLSATLHICGYGRLSREIEELAQNEPRLKFHGLLPTAEDCLRFGQSCDVLVNPRPDSHGNCNNFPSKIFEYALCQRAILSTRLSGVDAVLGDEAFYFETDRFAEDLASQLHFIARIARPELRRRGAALQTRICTEFNWRKQAARMSDFIQKL